MRCTEKGKVGRGVIWKEREKEMDSKVKERQDFYHLPP